MATKETRVEILHRHLCDKTCLCSINEELDLQRMSSFSGWIQRLPDDRHTANNPAARSVNKQDIAAKHAKTALDERDLKDLEQESDTGKDSSSKFQMPRNEVFSEQPLMQTSGCQKQLDNKTGGDVTGCEHDGGKSCGMEEEHQFDALRGRTLLCLTVGKELFESTHCERLQHLQLAMTGPGLLLEELGRLLASEDRLVAFLACQMATAVLSSVVIDKKDPARIETLQPSQLQAFDIFQVKSASFLQHHLRRSLATIKAFMSVTCQQLVTASHLPSTDPNQVDVDSTAYSGEIIKSRTDPCQINQSQKGHPDHGEAVQGQTDRGNSRRVCRDWDSMGQLNRGRTSRSGVNGSQDDESHARTIQPPSDDPSPSSVSTGQINHVIFTFDLCRHLLRKLSDKKTSRELKGRCERTKGREICTRIASMLTDEEGCEKLQGQQSELTHLLYINLPEMLHVFAQPASAQRPPRWRVDNIPHITLLLGSLLDLAFALLKQDGTRDQNWTTFTANLTTPLMRLFQEYCHDVIILKRTLDIFLLLTNQTTGTETHSSPTHHLHSVNVANSFLDLVVNGNLFDGIPYENGPLGFGGGHFLNCGTPDAGDDDVELGDRTLLRKLCRVTFSAMRILLCDGNCKSSLTEEGVEKCLHVLSSYVGSKVGLDVSSDLPLWLFKVFADQDDSLVWAMHCCLDLQKAVRSLPPSQLLEIHLNPHRIFATFLDTVVHDPSVLLDLLISTETPYLEYFVQYLHAVIGDWKWFCHSHLSMSSMGAKARSNESPDDVLDEESSEDDENASSDDVSVVDSPTLAGVDIGQNRDQHKETLGENSPTSKRRKIEGSSDLQTSDLQEAGWNSPPSQSNMPSQGDESEDDLSVETHASTSLISTGGTNQTMTGKTTEVRGGVFSTSRTVPPSDNPDATLSRGDTAASTESSHSSTAGDIQELTSHTFMSRSLEEAMTTLIRLRFLIERISDSDLFPYPVTPLLRLLKRVEDMYDSMA